MAFGASFVTLFLAPGALSPYKDVPPVREEDPVDRVVHVQCWFEGWATHPPVGSICLKYAWCAVELSVCFLGVFQGGEEHVTERHWLPSVVVLHGARIEADVRRGEAPSVALGDQVSKKVVVLQPRFECSYIDAAALEVHPIFSLGDSD